MFKFFRKIRQNLLSENKFSKYLIYAIGEIILVVIGILIALQINNWNEERKSHIKESLLIKNIAEDLELDSVQINQTINELENQISVIDGLIENVLAGNKTFNQNSIGLIRYSSDFRPISQRNHVVAVSNLGNELTRKSIQRYFLKEDQVLDIFREYEDIIHNKIRPHLSEVGMHNLKSLYSQPDELDQPLLLPHILAEQLENEKFKQLLFERRLKTDSFQNLMNEINNENQALVKILRAYN